MVLGAVVVVVEITAHIRNLAVGEALMPVMVQMELIEVVMAAAEVEQV